MAGLCEGGNEPPGSLKANVVSTSAPVTKKPKGETPQLADVHTPMSADMGLCPPVYAPLTDGYEPLISGSKSLTFVDRTPVRLVLTSLLANKGVQPLRCVKVRSVFAPLSG
ncbi:hypothetical protein ANN_00106 [Periplaneta americana]|uniref:Uncharacterized protein n=1 Tax=Periplaneta americana TaxID=6978 RepID=A0ABQ8TSM0_PERAM|nr:hypothetical protein ANN_00106 [Periplaneta americana]